MATATCAESVALARSAALTWAAAALLSTWRRMRPHRSRSQSSVPSTVKLVRVVLPPPPLLKLRTAPVVPLDVPVLKLPPLPEPLPLVRTPALTPNTGNRPARATRTSRRGLPIGGLRLP